MSTPTQENPLTLKALTHKPVHLTGGHRMCSGCGAPTIVRQVLMAIDEPVVIANATGCLEVSTCLFPYTAWQVPWMHSAFENAAATASGIETMYRSLRKQGKLKKEMKFIAFGGDGGTYDIGFQALSGAMERGHQLLYICYDNGAYMNTGIQRSSATPFGADTTTQPVGSKIQGKTQRRKDLTRIMAAHNVAYAAQASPHNWKDLMTKVRKALATNGPAYMGVVSPCNRGWRSQTNDSILLSRLAVETCYWPLYEVQDGKWTINYDPKDRKKPITEWLKPQGRFKHLFAPGNEALLARFQELVDQDWESLKKLQEMSKS
ncbi:MAG: thiamine pyrophosphate-dependent enzyme [Nitrospiraceae bacterium]|nr:thiamine pyrophosphate-dependent enzyme [Nitrospiraceae bacterium]